MINKITAACLVILGLMTTSCEREPMLHLHQGGADVDIPIPSIDLNLKVVWNYLFKYDVEYDWQAEWIYGWDETDQSMFGSIGYTEPKAFEVRRYFTGNTQYGTHTSPYKHTVNGNSIYARYDFGFWDILAWNYIDTPDGVQSVRIDETSTYEYVTAYTGQTMNPSSYNAPNFSHSFWTDSPSMRSATAGYVRSKRSSSHLRIYI